MAALQTWLQNYSTDQITLLLGIFVGLLFGAFAQQSRFCLRAATVEFWRGQIGVKFAIWLFAFATALVLSQLLMTGGYLEAGDIRQLATTGSLSGAIVGGGLFGIGMVLARGCASRLLVLSATGNQRALIAGLIVTLVSQASLRGGLSPARQEISSWWTVSPAGRNLGQYIPEYSSHCAWPNYVGRCFLSSSQTPSQNLALVRRHWCRFCHCPWLGSYQLARKLVLRHCGD